MKKEQAETATKVLGVLGNFVKAAARAKSSKRTNKPEAGGLAGVSVEPPKPGCGACGSK